MRSNLILLAILLSATVPAVATKTSKDVTAEKYQEALDREKGGHHNEVYSSEMDFLISQIEVSEKNWEINPYEFLGAIKIIVDRADIKSKLGPKLSTGYAPGKTISVEIFKIFKEQVKTAFKKDMKISEDMAEALGQVLEKQAVMKAKIDYSDYMDATGQRPLATEEIYERIAQADSFLMKSSVIDHKTDVPYVAGYRKDDSKHILIDRHIPSMQIIDGKKLLIDHYLNVHERVEKTLLDAFSLTYPHGHQLAYRLERATNHALAYKVLKTHAPKGRVNTGEYWEAYDKAMGKLIAEIGEEDPKLVDPKLDMLPYYTYLDSANRDLVRRMLLLMGHPSCEGVLAD